MTIAATHTVVKSRPADRRFGAGLLRNVPHDGRKPFTQADLDWSAQAFARPDDGTPYDLLAAEAAGYDAMMAGLYA